MRRTPVHTVADIVCVALRARVRVFGLFCFVGCPMLTHVVLQGFYQQRLLSFDYGSGVWQWDLDAIARTDVPADVADVLCAHMHSLPQALQDILQYAALLGSHFSLLKLHTVMQLPVSELAAGVCALDASSTLICTAGANELLMLRDAAADEATATPGPSSSSGTIVPSDSARLAECHMAFAHAKIQSAALRLIPPERLGSMHLWIAHHLLLSLCESDLEESAREVLDHLVRGRARALRLFCSLFAQHAHRLRQLVHLATLAGQQSRKAGEPHAALDFFTAALQLLEQLVAFQPAMVSPVVPGFLEECASAPPALASQAARCQCAELAETTTTPPPKEPAIDMSTNLNPLYANFIRVAEPAWQLAYEQTLGLYDELGQMLLLTDSLVAAEGVFEYVHQHARTVIDMAPFFALNISALRQQNRLMEALLCSLNHAEELDVKLIREPSEELRRFMQPPSPLPPDLLHFDDATLAQHPICRLPRNSDHPVALVSMQLLTSMVPVLAHLGSPLFANLAWTMADLTRQHGGCSEAAVAVALVAIDVWRQNDMQLTAYLAQLAMYIVKQDVDCNVRVKGAVFTLCLGRICQTPPLHTLQLARLPQRRPCTPQVRSILLLDVHLTSLPSCPLFVFRSVVQAAARVHFSRVVELRRPARSASRRKRHRLSQQIPRGVWPATRPGALAAADHPGAAQRMVLSAGAHAHAPVAAPGPATASRGTVWR